MTNDGQQGKVLGEFAAKNLGAKKIAVIDFIIILPLHFRFIKLDQTCWTLLPALF